MGFDALDDIDPRENIKPEQEISPELFERHDYLVFVFDNDLDWQVITQRLGIKAVKTKKIGSSTIIHTGTGRVIDGKKLLEMTSQ